MNDSTSTTPTASSSERWITPNGDIRDLDWFEGFGLEDDVASWELRTELDGYQRHYVSTLLDAADPDVRVLPAYAPEGSFSIPELMTFIEELQRCLTAARYIAGMKAVAA